MEIAVEHLQEKTNALEKSAAGLNQEIDKTFKTIGTIQGFPAHNGYVRSNGTWGATNNTFQHVVIPIESGQNILFVGHPTENIGIAFLTGYTEPVDKEGLLFSEVESFNNLLNVYANRSFKYVAPNDAKYLYIQTKYNMLKS